jgi:hypothetical protein
MTRASRGALLCAPALALLALLTLACADNLTDLNKAPEGPATLLVDNTTCDPGPCVPLAIRGLIPKFTVPGQPPTGFLAVGTVDSASACLTLPPSDSLRIIGPNDTTMLRWTQADPIALTASNALSMAIWLPPMGQTDEFTPASSPGWHVTFPGDSGRAVLEPADRCGGV